MTYLEEKISTEAKVILHLSKYSKLRDIYVVPPATTQQGIADSIRASRNYVSVVLDRLIAQGLVTRHTTRVVGSKRKKRAYFLTVLGDSYANDLRTEFANSVVRVLTDEGIREMRCLELKEIINHVPDLVELIKIIEANGVIDITKEEIPVPPPHQEIPSSSGISLGYVGIRKVCVLGDKGTGKTSLIRKYVYGTFDERYTPTLGVNISTKLIRMDAQQRKVILKLQIWDVMGNPWFRRVCQAALQGASGVVIVCDMTKKETLKTIDTWVGLMVESAGDIPWLVVINKSDISGPIGLGRKEVSDRVSKYGVPYFFASARTSEHLDDIFKTLSEQILLRENIFQEGPSSVLENRLLSVFDTIIDEYCKRHGGYEISMNNVRIAFESVGIDLNRLTRETIIKFIDELVSLLKENRNKTEQERRILLNILEKEIG